MAVSGNLPKHLEVAARTGVLAVAARDDMPYRRVAMEVDLTAASTTFVDLGGLPVPTQDPRVLDTMVERGKTVAPEDWYLTVHITQNAIDDDQTGTLEARFRGVLPAFQRHINSRTFTVLNAGDAATYGTGISNATTFFANSHIYPGAKYTTGQDNLNGSTLSLDNFNTVWVAMRGFRDDQGNFLNLNPNLLVVHPTNNVIAANITGNTEAMDTANRERNPYTSVGYLTAPELDTTAWFILDESQPVKPLYVAIRKRPALNQAWFDPQTEEGGTYYWQYHARYVIGYGDPLLCVMGNT